MPHGPSAPCPLAVEEHLSRLRESDARHDAEEARRDYYRALAGAVRPLQVGSGVLAADEILRHARGNEEL